MTEINLHLGDCMEAMSKMEDNAYDLAIVDPPYGIGADEKNSCRKLQSKKSATLSKNYGNKSWDKSIPTNRYFTELKRVSAKQVVWGANYFNLQGGMLYWHKRVTMPTYSQGELAWISWFNKIDFVDIAWHGMIQHDMKNKEMRIHPTQKPVALYKWLLKNYAKEGDKILDTHLGSGSIAIACHDGGWSLDAWEIDEEYYTLALNRFNTHKKQLRLL